MYTLSRILYPNNLFRVRIRKWIPDLLYATENGTTRATRILITKMTINISLDLRFFGLSSNGVLPDSSLEEYLGDSCCTFITHT